MVHPLLIALALLTTATDAYGPARTLPPVAAAVWTLVPLACAWISAHLAIRRCGLVIDRTGSRRALARAESVARAFSILIPLLALGAYLGAGWLTAVRDVLGDTVALDETLAAAPFVLALVAGWWSFAPIERRLIDATLFRALDEAQPVHPPPSARQIVTDRARHTLAIGVVVIIAVLAWAETTAIVLGHSFERGVIASAETAELLGAGLQLAVAVPVLVCAPLLIRALWDTVPLVDGALNERITKIATMHRVRYRRVLIWRTRGAMLNGAVVGLIAPLRYVLLTDALIERLNENELDAVIAHEIAHVKHRHLPWLLLATAAGAGVFGVGAAILLRMDAALPSDLQGVVAVGASVVGAVLVFGHVSRVFERQADAFAAQTLSKQQGSETVGEEAARAMNDALTAVARFNHIPEVRFGFRHGSIARRKRNVMRTIGVGVKRLPVDASVRRLKVVTLIGGAVAVGAAYLAA